VLVLGAFLFLFALSALVVRNIEKKEEEVLCLVCCSYLYMLNIHISNLTLNFQVAFLTSAHRSGGCDIGQGTSSIILALSLCCLLKETY
jgi:hypothetical protein